MDRYFAEHVLAPADLHDFTGHIRHELAAIQSSRVSPVQRRQLLLQGTTFPARPVDLEAWRGPPAMPLGMRSFSSMVERLSQLIMPEEQADARDAFIEALGIDDPELTADHLVALQRDCPDAVTALLELRIGAGHREMLRHPLWHGRPTDRREILTALTHVRIAYWLRTVAMEEAGRLHRPYGWAPLDSADSDDAVRYGRLWQRFAREIDRVRALVALFEANAALPSGDYQAADRLVAGLPPWGMDAEASVRHWDDICLRSRVQEREWQRIHNSDLRNVVGRAVGEIKTSLVDLQARLHQSRPTDRTHNMRVANMTGADPLEVLYHAARLATRWTHLEPPRKTYGENDAASSNRVQGSRRLVDWVMMPPSDRGACPLPNLAKDQADLVRNIFTVLRFALVDDDNMLPASLRVHVSSDGVKTHLRSQADAAKAIGRRFSFDELLSAHQAGSGRLDIVRRFKLRKNKQMADFSPSLRSAMTRHLAWFQDGLA